MDSMAKRRLIEKYGETCAVCGVTGVNLEVHHIVPKIKGGTDDDDNLVLVCSSCNYRFPRSSFTEVEFNNYLYSLIEKSGNFYDIKLEERLAGNKPFRADITAKTKDNKKWLFECKNTSSFTSDRLQKAIQQIEYYRKLTKFENYVLAFPGMLSEEQLAQLNRAKIIPWDLTRIATLFKDQISTTSHPIFKYVFTLSTSKARKSPESIFIDKLKNCEKGIKYWSDYQKLTGQILEHLFCPPLESPIPESADFNDINRRDLVLPNYSDTGFWCFIREKYLADYIVIDSKNYKNPISKGQILQIANYLKIHGAGMFAIIVTRIGTDKGSLLTIREQWMANQKMIVIINDKDIEAMLLAKSAGGDPSKVIGQKIEQFRLSM